MLLHAAVGLGGLMVLACLVQAWTIRRAVVPAQDSVRYLAVAQAIGRDGLLATVRSQPEQPLFPALAWLTHETLARTGLIAGRDWAVSLQVAAAIPLVISVAPIYLLFRRWHGHVPALISTILYCLLGATSRLGADGLSDSTHLLLFWCAVAAAAAAFARLSSAHPSSSLTADPRILILALASGVLAGLALLARAEAIVLPLAVLGALALMQFKRERRQASWKPDFSRSQLRDGAQFGLTRRASTSVVTSLSSHCQAAVLPAAVLLLGLGLPLAPYLLACRPAGANVSEAMAPAAARLLGRLGAGDALPLNESAPVSAAAVGEPRWSLPGVGRLVFGKKDTSTSSRFRGWWAAAVEACGELVETLHYGLGLLALVGLWSARGRLSSPVDRFMQLLCAALVMATLYVGATAGYLSTRHLLLLVVLALGWAGVGAVVCGEWLTRVVLRSMTSRLLSVRLCKPCVAALAIAACLPDLARPLHASRAGHRQAADWLLAHAAPSDRVLDSRGWTALYTGRKTYRYEAAQTAFRDAGLAYVVVEQAEFDAPSRRAETLRLLMAEAAEPVARFGPALRHEVVVHRWRPERFALLEREFYAR